MVKASGKDAPNKSEIRRRTSGILKIKGVSRNVKKREETKAQSSSQREPGDSGESGVNGVCCRFNSSAVRKIRGQSIKKNKAQRDLIPAGM